ncbi:MAG: outer membrane protein transport protein [Proteobacteria bacterium]|nr:outer membrane protein transport protein [Pseudomonadota bacterium]MBU1736677.1 outer membrane protein transport protein [Pseudomonadota bacterium]
MTKKSLVLTILIILLFYTTASALVLDTDVYTMDFRINNPGARANAMGGAFTGVADDATAAYTNPAGLAILTAPEVSVEYKNSGLVNRLTLGPGVHKDYEDRVYGISFLSYVHPKDNATFAVYRHQLLDLESSFPLGTATNKLDITADVLAVGMGFKLSDSFSLGASFGFAELDYYFQAKKTDGVPGDFIYLVDGEDKDQYYSASLLWSPADLFNLGLVYRYGPEFTTHKDIYRWDNLYSRDFVLQDKIENTLKVPDVYSLGLSFRLFSSVTLAADVNHVMYSQLKKNLKLLPLMAGGNDLDYIEIDDEQEYHVGLEYVFNAGATPMALRCGYYFRPEHKFYTTNKSIPASSLTMPGEDDHIYSGGIGFVASEKVQIDMAASIGEFIDEYILSMVYRF